MSREVMQMALDVLIDIEMSYECEREIKALRAALAQPKPEPVCLMVIKGEISYKSTAEDQSFGMWCPVDYYCNHSLPDGTKFYTSPPKREWVGLSDAEVVERSNKEVFAEAFARGVAWAELKLKGKNGG